MYSRKDNREHLMIYGVPYVMGTKRVSMNKSVIPERVRNLISANSAIISSDTGQELPVLKG